MTDDVAVFALIGCACGLLYLALHRYTDWTQYRYGILELHKLWEATGRIRAKWTAVWLVEGGCGVSVVYIFMRLVYPGLVFPG